MLLLGAYKINAYICERLTNIALQYPLQGPPVSGSGSFLINFSSALCPKHGGFCFTIKINVMAKSKSFFGLRSGSTKSLTFQVYRGQQITKDRVYRVSNPRTDAQMTQRALIPIVAAARSALKGLVDHSFEGIAYGEASLKEFSKQNLRAGALSVTSFSPNGVSNAGFANLIVSNGSIDGDFVLDSSTDKGNKYSSKGQYPDLSFPAAKANDPATAILNYLASYAKTNNVPLLKPGTQLTFLTVYEAGTVGVKTAAGTTEASLSDFAIDRFMVPDTETATSQIQDVNGDWKVKDDITANATSATIVNGVGDEISISCSQENENSITIVVNPKAAAEDANCGGALILSRYDNGTWRRNSATIKIGFEPKHKYSFNDWLSVFQATGAASKKYLNNGDESTGIQG